MAAEYTYKAVIFNKIFCKEILLSDDKCSVKVGTDAGSDVRIWREVTAGSMEIEFARTGDKWILSCAGDLYFDTGDSRKLLSVPVNQTGVLILRRQDTGSRLLNIDISIVFNNQCSFNRTIDISCAARVSIGAQQYSDILLRSQNAKDEQIVIDRSSGETVLRIIHTRWDIHRNGSKAADGEKTGNRFFISVADYVFYINGNEIWTHSRDDMVISGFEYHDYCIAKDFPRFSKSTRLKPVLAEGEIQILDPPPIPKRQEGNTLLRIMPSLGMLAVAMIMAMKGSGIMLVFSGMSAAMGIFSAVAALIRGKRKYSEECENRKNKYRKYIASKCKEIEEKRAVEQDVLEAIYKPPEKLVYMLKEFSYELFDRTTQDEDFLALRLGRGRLKARKRIAYQHQERLEHEDELQMIPEKIFRKYEYMDQCPISVKLTQINALGICGKEEYRSSVLQNMVIDLAARHLPDEVKMVFSAAYCQQIYWLRMLPHTILEDADARGIVTDEAGRKLIYEYLYKELMEREQGKSCNPHLIVFVYDDLGFSGHPLSKFVDRAADLGTTFIYFCNDMPEMISGCGYCFELKDKETGYITDANDCSQVTQVSIEQISRDEACDAVGMMAPLRIEESSLERELPDVLSLFQMMDVFCAEDIDLESRWTGSDISVSMAAPVGTSKSGLVYLDLHDSAMGPHGLVAGTTGSGKSEFLQTYILTMASLYHPYQVQFLIIDFKGGGMAAQLKDLPHLSGVITNLEGSLTGRSLKAIRAELTKRQRIFEECDVNHIDRYIRKSRADASLVPLPHLIIIVDEFAELKAQHPEFMKELISAARIGRSLGVHLILATQKPSGQVDEQIWSNSRFRICLKVQNANDSKEVIKSPLAAEIRDSGRAYLQVGNNEIFELFQSAYCGLGEHYEEEGADNFCIFELSASGTRKLIYEKNQENKDESNVRVSGRTQMHALVRHISGFCKMNNILPMPPVCLEPLENSIDYPKEKVKSCQDDALSGIWADIGIFDDPEHQDQGVYTADLSSGNLMMTGPSRSGKTNLVQTIIRSLAEKYSVKDLNIYIIDFASQILKGYEKLPHVGGVVCPDDDEKLRNLFKMINLQMKERKNLLSKMGMGSFEAYKASGNKSMPFILLIIDNLAALREIYLEDDYELLSICRDGPGLGINVVIANQRVSGIGYKYLADFPSRVAFHCNDQSEYSYLFGRIEEEIPDIPGRCIVQQGTHRYECQIYKAFAGENEKDKASHMEAFISHINKVNQGNHARKIPVVPELITQKDVIHMAEAEPEIIRSRPYSIIAGLNYADVEPFRIEMNEAGVLSIAGKKGSGMHIWVRYLLNAINRQSNGRVSVYAIDGIARKLEWIKESMPEAAYSILPQAGIQYIKEISEQARKRYERISCGDFRLLDEMPLLILIIDNMDAIHDICADPAALEAYRGISGKYKYMNICMIIMCMENVPISYNAPEIIKDIRDARHYLYFDNIKNMRLFDPPLSMAKEFNKPVGVSDAYYIRNNDCVKLKIPQEI